ncbi:MAG: DUF2169 domain-containing protein [Polyangiales bacterium]
MDLVKDSPFELALTTWRVRPAQDSLVAVVKATFAIAPGGPCTVAEEQRLCEGDVPWDDAEGASLRSEADLAVYKPQGECFLVGSCRASGGRSVASAAVSFSLGSVRKELAVHGDRTWGALGVASAAAPFTEVPLRWERAFGGAGFAANPVGRGTSGDALPNLEDPRAPLRAPGDVAVPVCTAPVPRAWPARAALAGTYDDVWERTRFPWFPEDFDWRYFLAAPPDQRIDGFWRGDETFSMAGVRPDGAHVHGRLPGLRPRLFLVVETPKGRSFQEVLLQLDTVTLDADAMEAVCLWRGLLDVSSPRHPELAAAFLAHETLDAPADAAAHLARFEALERERLADESPAPDPVPPSPMAAPDAPSPPPRDLRAEVLAALEAGDSLAGRDLTGADLAGLDLAGLDLAGAMFHDAKLAGASLAGSRLTEALFARADLAGASLAQAFAQRADFTDARLDGADFRGANLGDAVFAGASLTGAALGESVADGADLAGADLTLADLTRASLVRADLTRARLTRARCDGAALRDAGFSEVSAAGASFAGADLTDLRANDGCDLTGALLRGVKAEGSKWHGARLDDADLALSALGRADFSGASLERARLDGCALRGARFVDARMAGASLLKADLMEGTLEGADLTRADLRAASLHGVDLWRTTAEGAATELAVLTGTRWERP